jgi:ribonucleotide monophosphatase NagD (HAD superfamily)
MGAILSKTAMMGYDIITDIGCAKNYSMVGILVKTGKYREDLVSQSVVNPDYVIDSLALLPTMFR